MVLDLVREVRAPFSPEQVVADFVRTLKPYRLMQMTGGRFGDEWCRQPFRKAGLMYQLAPRTRSDLYKELLLLVNRQTAVPLDDPRLLTQLYGLERHTARSGKDTIDHRPHQHDDVAYAAAGALVLANGSGTGPGIFLL